MQSLVTSSTWRRHTPGSRIQPRIYPIEIERRRHTTCEMLLGEGFPDAAIMKAMASVDAIVTHDVKLDRAFVTRRPGADGAAVDLLVE